MKTNTRFWYDPLLAGLLIAFLALAGCDGDDGAPGAPGVDGADGADGADAIILADIVPINPVLDLSNTIAYDPVSGAVTIHFFLTDEDGNGIDVTTDAYELRVYATELIDNNDGTSGQSWNPLWNERGTPAAGSPLPGTLTLVDAATGEYTYVCDNTLPTSSNVQRVIMRARWRETINGVRWVFANPVNTSYDFLQADPGNELASSGADMVLTENCETCHGARIGDVGHGGGYTQVKTCNNCHNINYMTSRNGGEGDLAHMLHTIHSAGVFKNILDDHVDPPVPYDFSHVTFPTHIYDCATCHGGAPEENLAYTVPTRMNCGACHRDVDFATGTGHGFGGARPDDTQCSTCHVEGSVYDGASGQVQLGPIAAHDHDTVLAKTPENIPEFDVTISMLPAPANGEYYVAGETPVAVGVTLVDKATGNPVPGTVYTTPQDGECVAGNLTQGLSTANLYVYGPRAEAVPVLTTNSTTDPAWDPATNPTQGHPLFVGGTDPQVITNSTGFWYQLMDNFADLQPGTYMVRFEGEDYGACADDDYRTASSALITFQVGTAEEEPKVAGDACFGCHGERTRHVMHLEGQHPHHAPFDTDHCLGCHDKSENYGNYIGNRVHAVHSASATGDLHLSGGLPRNWSHVTFPQDVNNCTICHTNTETDTPVWRTPNAVACGGCHGTQPNPDPADYPDVDPAQLTKEAAAAQHMLLMGGDFLADTDPTLQCLVCHGEDRIADLYDTHHLVLFPPPVVPEP